MISNAQFVNFIFFEYLLQGWEDFSDESVSYILWHEIVMFKQMCALELKRTLHGT